MNNLILLITLIIAAPTLSKAGESDCKIIKVIDGDTFTCDDKQKVRMTLIDSYEKAKNNRAFKQAYQLNLSVEEVVRKGKIASQISKTLLLNKTVKIVWDDKNKLDQYNRILAEVFINNESINKKLLAEHSDVFLKYE